MATTATTPIEYENARDAAARLDINVRTLERLVARGELTAYRLGRMVRFRKGDVDALLVPSDTWR